METEQIKQIVEAAILAADGPLDRDALLMLFDEGDRPDRVSLSKALESLQQDYEGRGVELREVASGFRFQVRRDMGPWVSRLWQEKPPRYSRAVMETLALVAYRQPITRGEIEEVRGVTVSTQIIRTLQERNWVRVVGHRDVPGRPAMYATTRQFLDYFDLKSLEDLPPLSEIRDLDRINEELQLEDDAGDAEAARDGEGAGVGGEESDEQDSAEDREAEDNLVSFVSAAEDEPEVDESTLMDMEEVDAVLADFESRFREKPAAEQADDDDRKEPEQDEATSGASTRDE